MNSDSVCRHCGGQIILSPGGLWYHAATRERLCASTVAEPAPPSSAQAYCPKCDGKLDGLDCHNCKEHFSETEVKWSPGASGEPPRRIILPWQCSGHKFRSVKICEECGTIESGNPPQEGSDEPAGQQQVIPGAAMPPTGVETSAPVGAQFHALIDAEQSYINQARNERDKFQQETIRLAMKVAELQAERDRLQALHDEQESVVLQAGPISCRNGKTHPREADCLYCRAEAAEASLAEWPKAISRALGANEHSTWELGEVETLIRELDTTAKARTSEADQLRASLAETREVLAAMPDFIHENRITSASPIGPLHGAGWNDAIAHVCKRVAERVAALSQTTTPDYSRQAIKLLIGQSTNTPFKEVKESDVDSVIVEAKRLSQTTSAQISAASEYASVPCKPHNIIGCSFCLDVETDDPCPLNHPVCPKYSSVHDPLEAGEQKKGRHLSNADEPICETCGMVLFEAGKCSACSPASEQKG